MAASGTQGFTWLILLAVLFVFPYALVLAELGSTFTEEGGPYEWVKMSFGRFHASLAAIFYWVTNPLWVGGSLAFIACDAWASTKLPSLQIGELGKAGDYVFKFLFIWFSIGVAIASLKRGKWIPTAGGFARIFVLGFFTLTVVIYGIKNGVQGIALGDLSPSMAVFLGLVPYLLFNYVGFELQNGAAEEMVNPARDVPLSVARSGVLGVALYVIPVLGILLVLPSEKVTGHRRVHRRDQGDVHRLRRRPERALRDHGARVHLHAAHVGRRVDDRLGPDPGRVRLRRRLLPVLRRLQRQARHARARQHDVGHHVDDLHGHRRADAQER